MSEDGHHVRGRLRIPRQVCLEVTWDYAGPGRKRLRHRASRAVNGTKSARRAGRTTRIRDGAVLIVTDPVQGHGRKLRRVGDSDREGKLPPRLWQRGRARILCNLNGSRFNEDREIECYVAAALRRRPRNGIVRGVADTARVLRPARTIGQIQLAVTICIYATDIVDPDGNDPAIRRTPPIGSVDVTARVAIKIGGEGRSQLHGPRWIRVQVSNIVD